MVTGTLIVLHSCGVVVVVLVLVVVVVVVGILVVGYEPHIFE
jgi:hypothetical protein